MKAISILYLVLIVGIIYWIVTSTDLLHYTNEGFKDIMPSPASEPVIPKFLPPTSIKMDAMPNPSTLDALPFGPYAQMASTGSYQYKDPSTLPAGLTQMKKINEDLRSFLVFEGVSLADTSDPSVQLPLTQLRADSQRLQSEISVLDKNPGIDSQLTQQDLANIEGSLTFLQRKVRLFETSGVITEGFVAGGPGGPGGPEGPEGPGGPGGPGGLEGPDGLPLPTGTVKSGTAKTRATLTDLIAFQRRIHAAILILSSSGTTDPVVQARIKALQDMYTAITDMIIKVNNGTMLPANIPVYQEDINVILPRLADPEKNINTVFNQPSGIQLSPIEQGLSTLVGEEHATSVFNNLKDKGMFRVSVDLGYNVNGSNGPVFSQTAQLRPNGTMSSVNQSRPLAPAGPPHYPGALGGPGAQGALGGLGGPGAQGGPYNNNPMGVNLPFDSSTPGMDDRSASNSKNKASNFDWKSRAASICEQVRLRGLDPEDFGCIAKDSLMSPAYSWRGHSKMICGRLAATMDPGLPVTCGCPPSNWKGWTLST